MSICFVNDFKKLIHTLISILARIDLWYSILLPICEGTLLVPSCNCIDLHFGVTLRGND